MADRSDIGGRRRRLKGIENDPRVQRWAAVRRTMGSMVREVEARMMEWKREFDQEREEWMSKREDAMTRRRRFSERRRLGRWSS